ncbi:MAG: hypothetical protein NVS1B11_05830 [Terriglobales bacterium]
MGFLLSRCIAVLLLVFAITFAQADDSKAPPHMSKQTRVDLIHAFSSELVYIRAVFPMGKRGLTLENGTLAPSGKDLEQALALWGPAVKPGDRALITAINIQSSRIRFEVNGGPVKKQKWYQHVQVGMGGATTPVSPSDSTANPRGSYVDLVFPHYVPDLNPQQLKDLLRPVFDFNAKSPLEAYLETVPPKVKDAIKDHHVLVGMNREMVIYAKGRSPKKIREKDGETEYEDWIYGEPPQDVDFVRLVGDEVVRVETMKVNGEKTLRTEKEIDLQTPVAKDASAPVSHPLAAPSLRRPGEEPETQPQPGHNPGSRPPVADPGHIAGFAT